MDYADFEVHMLVWAGAESVDERRSINLLGCFVHLRSTMLSTAPSRCMN